VKVDDTTVRERLAHFKAAARTAGLKLTHQRLEIFREVASSLEHPDAETVFRAVRKRMPTVSLDTVYRTLATLSDLGLVIALSLRRDGVRFDANLDRHHHFVCVRCGLTRDFESAELDTLQVPAVAEGFGRVIAARVEVRGMCKKCARIQAGQQVQGAPE
jgi:Fur family transcriptional regulator, peroxide stress response regulator